MIGSTAAVQAALALFLTINLTAGPAARAVSSPAGGTVQSVETVPSSRFQFILHAGGVTPQGIAGSNSVEALDWSYQQGYRMMELDFCWTEDGELVCVHDWDAYYARQLGKAALTLAEFEQLRGSRYGFTSLTLSHLAQWMQEHPDAQIVTDIKERNPEGAALIARRYPQLMDQFVIQIYSTQEYEAVSQLGFDNIILTLYQMSWAEETDTTALSLFLRSHKLVGLTFPVELAGLSSYVEQLSQAGVPLFVHTVNDAQTQADLFAQGIAGIYTDTGADARENRGL